MNNAARVIISVEHILQMKAWGYWAQSHGINLGYKSAMWQSEVISDSWPESAPPPPIDDEYAQWVASKLSQLNRLGHETEVMIVLQLYRGRSSKGLNRLAKTLRWSSPKVAGARDFVLNTIYGALTERGSQ